MKNKGITIWENRAEFFVLGAVAIVFVVYLIGQFDSPNIREVDRQPVAPGEWHEKLKETAIQIKRDQESQTVPPAVESAIETGRKLSSVDLADFQAQMIARQGPETPSSIPGYRVVPAVSGDGEVRVANAKFVDPSLMPPTKPEVYQTFDLLQDGVVEEHESLATIVTEEPHDISWITVASQFNIADALLRFRTNGPDGELPLRERWHGNRIDLLDVRVEREELVDGQWTDAQMIDILPGQLSFRDRLANHQELDAADRDEILATVVDPVTRTQIYQPDFLPTQRGRWVSPEKYQADEAMQEAMDNAEMDPKRRTLMKKLAREIRKRDEILALLQRAQESGLAGSGGAGGGAGGGGGTRGGAGGGGAGTSDPLAPLKERLAQSEAKIASYRQELGLDQDGNEIETESGGEVQVEENPLDQTDEIWVWAHDITAEMGHTYRYRVSVVIYNPLFARKLSLVEEQKHLAESLIKVVDSSVWSEPLTAQPPLRVLASSAIPASAGANTGRLGYGQATAEVRRFYGGQWWSNTFKVQPGDVVGHPGYPEGLTSADMDPVDFSTGWYVVDVVPRIDATGVEIRGGKGARIVLQHLEDDRIMVIDPQVDSGDVDPEEAAL
ncbi:MAG: hypothetical protein CMJ39_10195 [Phycisphaerae bacterium]|nr:hypothetical protein [Phycisphaerae bacterium]